MINATKLDYLENTYLFSGSGKIIDFGQGDKGSYIILDQTIFYPQGGGQPSDLGKITVNGLTLVVQFVGFDSGKVLHFVTGSDDLSSLVGNEAILEVNEERRLQNAALHTGGHLVAGIIDRRDSELRATKGYHFSDGPHVEFEGRYGEDPPAFIAALQEEVDAFMAEEHEVVTEMVSYDELASRCPNIPSYLPKDKPLRIVTIGGLEPLPCGGTHVRSTSELGSLKVTRVKARKGNTKVSYNCG